MRVITGEARGRRLKTPANDDVRPTTDSVKEAVFNILRDDVEGRRVLDLFAGTGQLGIEAISRGAKEAVFVDRSRLSIQMVRDNIKLCGFEDRANVVVSDALSYLQHCGRFDLIFVDPPYDADLYNSVLETINTVDILNEGGIISVEAKKEEPLPVLSSPYRLLKEYRYGKIKICTYIRETSAL